jgi:hypothetical protein
MYHGQVHNILYVNADNNKTLRVFIKEQIREYKKLHPQYGLYKLMDYIVKQLNENDYKTTTPTVWDVDL